MHNISILFAPYIRPESGQTGYCSLDIPGCAVTFDARRLIRERRADERPVRLRFGGNGAYGSVLAKCENGQIYEGGSSFNRVIAWYEGDMYGAAAAAAVTLLGLEGEGQSDVSSNGTSSVLDSDFAARVVLFFKFYIFLILPFYQIILVSLPVIMVFGFISVIVYIPSLIHMVKLNRNHQLRLDHMRNTALLWLIVGPFAWLYLRPLINKQG